jgi:peptidoglycan/LPS O-acetylase OafA/YrhL
MASLETVSVTGKSPQPSKGRYRPEIDGLRAFAVVAVIINHFNKDLLPSGYLGVDIFFVISGYVITSSLADRQSKNFLDFLTGFYERRIKRLVPALVVFVLITSVLISMFNPDPGVALDLGWQSLFGISNINLYLTSTDYFAQSTELNPFTHTWSLGVEEQFYLLFPFLIWFSGFGQRKVRGARNLFFWVGALTVVSLLGFIYLYRVNQPAAYFLMPPRFWEMAAGCLLFIGFQKRAKIEQMLEKVPPLLIVTSMVGVMFLPNKGAAVLETVSIVLLSAVLIACLKKGTAAYKFFTLEKVVFIGLISYSLYLWHWSVLCISRWTIGIHWWSVPIQVGLMLLLSLWTFKWIETPMRQAKWANRKYQSVIYGFLSILAAAALLKGVGTGGANKLFLGDHSREREENLRADKQGTIASVENCSWWMGKGPSLTNSLQNCTVNNNAVDRHNYKRFFILGDSHAGNLMGWVASISPRKDIFARILYVNGQSAPPIKRRYASKDQSSLKSDENKQTQLTTETLSQLRKGDTIILSNYLLHQLARSNTVEGMVERPPIETSKTMQDWLNRFENILSHAKTVGATVVVVLPLPDFKADTSMIDLRLCTNQWYRNVSQDCILKTSRESLLDEIRPISSLLHSLQKDYPNLHTYDPFELFCESESKFCTNYTSGKRTFLDRNHLNVYGANILAQDFTSFLKANQLMGQEK